jgi:hypothetical protein
MIFASSLASNPEDDLHCNMLLIRLFPNEAGESLALCRDSKGARILATPPPFKCIKSGTDDCLLSRIVSLPRSIRLMECMVQ